MHLSAHISRWCFTVHFDFKLISRREKVKARYAFEISELYIVALLHQVSRSPQFRGERTQSFLFLQTVSDICLKSLLSFRCQSSMD